VKRYSYWLDTAEQSAVGSRQSSVNSHHSLPDRVDVAVVGGGYTGLSAARRLAMAGASVVVLERDEIGSGASSRNGGQVLTGLKLDASTLVARFGEAKARELFATGQDAIASLETVIAGEAIACEYEQCGHVQAACKPSHFESFRTEQALLARVCNHRIELVSRSEQRSEIGSDVYHGLAIDEASRSINPAQYVSGLAAAARKRGVCLVSFTAVTALRRDGQRWRVSTMRGDVAAGDVLVATNGYTGAASPALRRRLIPIGSYIIATEPLTGAEAAAILPRRRVAFDSKHFLVYFRLTRDRRLLFGGRAEFSEPSADSSARAVAILRRGLAHVFPALATKAIEYAWSGNVAFTRDQIPRAGKLDGMYFAGGYCGHGIAMATHLGDVIARRIAGEPIEHPMMDDQMPPIPLYSGTPWFLPLVGAYYKVIDWLR
jgi:glycine/D-amino acid oxidase-like deaminating enzyme